VADGGRIAMVIPDFMIRELIELQKETRFDIEAMIVSAIRQFIDREKSNEDHVWVDGVKYPIPKRIP
jgi:predicted transcriptional regulator